MRHLECPVERKDGVAVIRPKGRLDSGQIGAFEKLLERLIKENQHHMVLDFGELRFISSSALRILLVTARKLRGKSGTFLLCELAPHVLDVMKTAGFDRLLDMRDSRDEAVAEAAREAARGAALARL